jgi:hypothetical protein
MFLGVLASRRQTDQQRTGETPALPGGKRMMATHRSEFRIQAVTISLETNRLKAELQTSK